MATVCALELWLWCYNNRRKHPPLLVTPTGESVSHQSSVTLISSKAADGLSPASTTCSCLLCSLIFYLILCCLFGIINQIWHPIGSNIIQICHASVGIMMECLPEGRWFSPRAEPKGKPSSRGETFHQDTHTGMVYLIYYTEQTLFWWNKNKNNNWFVQE